MNDPASHTLCLQFVSFAVFHAFFVIVLLPCAHYLCVAIKRSTQKKKILIIQIFKNEFLIPKPKKMYFVIASVTLDNKFKIPRKYKPCDLLILQLQKMLEGVPLYKC